MRSKLASHRSARPLVLVATRGEILSRSAGARCAPVRHVRDPHAWRVHARLCRAYPPCTAGAADGSAEGGLTMATHNRSFIVTDFLPATVSNTSRVLAMASLAMAAFAAFPIHAATAQLPAGTTPPTAEVLAAGIDSVVKADILPRGSPRGAGRSRGKA